MKVDGCKLPHDKLEEIHFEELKRVRAGKPEHGRPKDGPISDRVFV